MPTYDDAWKIIPNGKNNSCVIKGLERGKEYSVQVAVTGPKAKTIYSQVIHIIVT